MERTLRRPIDPGVPRIDRLSEPVGNALYFPDDQKVVDRQVKFPVISTDDERPALDSERAMPGE